MNDVIKANIIAIAKGRGITRKKLAEMIDMKENTFYSTCNRINSMFSHSNLLKIAKVLDVSISRLYSRTGVNDEQYYLVLDIIAKFRKNKYIEVAICKNEFAITEKMAIYMYGDDDDYDIKSITEKMATDRTNPILISAVKEFSDGNFQIVEIDISQLFGCYLSIENGAEIITHEKTIYNKPLIDYLA